MQSKKLNAVQIMMLVARMLSEMRFDELGKLAAQDQRVLQQLVRTLREGKGPYHLLAAAALSKTGTSAVAPLLAALQDEKYVVRQAAAVALGDIGDLSVVDRLIAALGDKHEVVRQAAAISLGKLRADVALAPLLRAITDKSQLVRKAIVNALGMIGDARALPALKRVAAEDVEAVAQRARAVIQEIAARNVA